MRNHTNRVRWLLQSGSAFLALAVFVLALDAPKSRGTARPLVMKTIHVGGSPNAVFAGLRGVWVVGAAREGAFVARISPRENRVVARIAAPVGSERACGIAVADESVWVAGQSLSGGGQLFRIDTRTNKLANRSISLPGATCIAVTPNSVWVTSAERGTLTRVDPATNRIAGRPIRTGGYPEGVVAAFGSVWVSDSQTGEVMRIDPTTIRIEAHIPAGHSPAYLARGTDGIWVSSNNGTVARIDARNNLVTQRVRVSSGGRTTLAIGLSRVWTTTINGPGSRGSVAELDPNKGVIRRRLTVGESPLGMAIGAGSLWVANFNDGTVTRITE